MDLFDLWWNYEQQKQIGELRGKVARQQLDLDLGGVTPSNLQKLTLENEQLRLRLGLLVRLLISKQVFSAQEYASLIAEALQKD